MPVRSGPLQQFELSSHPNSSKICIEINHFQFTRITFCSYILVYLICSEGITNNAKSFPLSMIKKKADRVFTVIFKLVF